MTSPVSTVRPSAAHRDGADRAADRAALPTHMRAATRTVYGGPEVLQVAEAATPRPGPGEVLVKVAASSLNFGDGVTLTGRPYLARLALGLRRPKNPLFGLDFAGEVVALGEGITDLAVGDRVFGESAGACAQFVVAPRGKLAPVPDGVSLQDAAAVPVAGVTALRAMQLADVQPGQRVLINGASGGVGSFAVQIARALGAEVTAVCSGRNGELVTALGATHVVDYTTADFTATEARYDVILDLVGSAPLSACRRSLTADGTYVASAGAMAWVLKSALTSLFDRRVKVLFAPVGQAELEELSRLLASGAVRPSIEHVWPLERVAEGMAHQLTGRTRGKCVVAIVQA